MKQAQPSAKPQLLKKIAQNGRYGPEEFEEAARQELQDDMNELERLSQEEQLEEANRRRKHGRKFSRSEETGQDPTQEEFWDCPICARPQVANDKDFNDHIDFCLSRQTIRRRLKIHHQLRAAAR
jgi:DNA polymerase kappa